MSKMAEHSMSREVVELQQNYAEYDMWVDNVKELQKVDMHCGDAHCYACAKEKYVCSNLESKTKEKK